MEPEPILSDDVIWTPVTGPITVVGICCNTELPESTAITIYPSGIDNNDSLTFAEVRWR